MNSKNLGQTLAIALGMIIGIYAAISILLNPTGGISGLSKLLALLGIVIGILNPKGGLFFLVVQAVYADEIKRIGVYYGVQSTQTVSEILIGPLLTLCAINVSVIHGFVRKQFKIDALGGALYLIAPAVGAIMFIKGLEGGVMLSGYLAATTALYITVIPICYGIFRSQEEWVKFVSWQIVVAIPAGLWAIWQYFHGFNSIEWSYANSGLSRVHSLQMMHEEPRVFGLFGSASALGCVGTYAIFSAWRTVRYRKHRLIFSLITLLYFAVVFFSQQRTLLVFPLIVLFLSFAFRRASTTLLTYLAIAVIGVLAVMNATYLNQEGLTKVNDAIAGNDRWSRSVLNVSTFSDRLRGWERLNRKESWSFFGTGEIVRSESVIDPTKQDYSADDYSHDIINRILINFGAVGLAAVFAIGTFFLVNLHKVIFLTRDWQTRKDGAFIMASIAPILLMALMGGDNFSTTPTNLQIWSIFSGIFLLRKLSTVKPMLSANSREFAADTPARAPLPTSY